MKARCMQAVEDDVCLAGRRGDSTLILQHRLSNCSRLPLYDAHVGENKLGSNLKQHPCSWG